MGGLRPGIKILAPVLEGGRAEIAAQRPAALVSHHLQAVSLGVARLRVKLRAVIVRCHLAVGLARAGNAAREERIGADDFQLVEINEEIGVRRVIDRVV